MAPKGMQGIHSRGFKNAVADDGRSCTVIKNSKYFTEYPNVSKGGVQNKQATKQVVC